MTTFPFPILIIVVPLISSFLVLLLGMVQRRLCYPFMLIALSICVISSFSILSRVLSHGTLHYDLGNWPPPLGY